jgi:RNA polymerase sigma-70 factor (ECF subfamily)
MVNRLEHTSTWSPLAHSVAAGAGAVEKEPTANPTAAEVFALVYRQMRALAGHRDVDELTQTAAEQAIRALPSFAGRSSLSTWTFRICFLTVRKHDRWYRRWLRRFTLTDDGQLPDRATGAPTLEDQRVQDERLARIRGALEKLSPKRRIVVILHDLEGLPVDDIAEIVGARRPAIRSRLRDGRKILADLLRHDPYFGDEACHREEQAR